MIRKVSDGYKVVSHQTGRSFGTYSTRAEAEARLRQIKGHSESRTGESRPQPAGPFKYRRVQHPSN